MISKLFFMKMMIRNPTLVQKSIRKFTIVSSKLLEENEHLVDSVLDLYATKMKQIVLDRSLLEKNKIIIPPIRMRRLEDTVEILRNNKLCSGMFSKMMIIKFV